MTFSINISLSLSNWWLSLRKFEVGHKWYRCKIKKTLKMSGTGDQISLTFVSKDLLNSTFSSWSSWKSAKPCVTWDLHLRTEGRCHFSLVNLKVFSHFFFNIPIEVVYECVHTVGERMTKDACGVREQLIGVFLSHHRSQGMQTRKEGKCLYLLSPTPSLLCIHLRRSML